MTKQFRLNFYQKIEVPNDHPICDEIIIGLLIGDDINVIVESLLNKFGYSFKYSYIINTYAWATFRDGYDHKLPTIIRIKTKEINNEQSSEICNSTS